MTFQLPADCLNEIIEYLEEDKISLRSCLSVNRLWCTVAVRILWRNVWNIQHNLTYNHQKHAPSSILSTLIACLPNESKNILNVNGISIPSPTSNPPSFNYILFIKDLTFYQIEKIIENAIKNQWFNTSTSRYLISRELLKAFMNQISSLKSLNYDF